MNELQIVILRCLVVITILLEKKIRKLINLLVYVYLIPQTAQIINSPISIFCLGKIKASLDMLLMQ